MENVFVIAVLVNIIPAARRGMSKQAGHFIPVPIKRPSRNREVLPLSLSIFVLVASSSSRRLRRSVAVGKRSHSFFSAPQRLWRPWRHLRRGSRALIPFRAAKGARIELVDLALDSVAADCREGSPPSPCSPNAPLASPIPRCLLLLGPARSLAHAQRHWLA